MPRTPRKLWQLACARTALLRGRKDSAPSQRRWGNLCVCIHRQGLHTHPGKAEASPAAFGGFSPVASSWQLLTAGRFEELDPFPLLQASAPSDPRTQIHGFFLHRYTRRQAKRGLWNEQPSGSCFPERLAWP